MRRPGAAGNLLGHLLTHLLTIYVLTFTLAFRAASTFLHAILSLASPSMVLQLWPRSYCSAPCCLWQPSSPDLLPFACPAVCGSCDSHLSSGAHGPSISNMRMSSWLLWSRSLLVRVRGQLILWTFLSLAL